MKLYEFNDLAFWQKLPVINELGMEIGERHDEKSIYILYQLFDFYAELMYEYKPNLTKVAAINCFESEDNELIEPYLNLIDLSGLIENHFD